MVGFIDVRGDISAITEHLSATSERHIPYAAKLALNKTIQFAQQKLKEEMPRLFDRPTPYSINSTTVKFATMQDLTAYVKIKDYAEKSVPPLNWLGPEIHGGTRHHKGSELLLIRANVMPSGKYLVPTKYMPLDAYGNVSRGTMQIILADCQASRDPHVRTTAASRERRRNKGSKALAVAGLGKFGLTRARNAAEFYFSTYPVTPRTAHLSPGIYRRRGSKHAHGSEVLPMFVFTDAPSYKARFDYTGIADGIARMRFPREFAVAMRYALATAK